MGLAYLVLLLEAIALGALHLGDVLQQVSYADGRVQLSRLVGDVNLLSLPQGVCMGLDQAAGVAAHVLTLVCLWGRIGERSEGDREHWGGHREGRAGQAIKT